MTSLRTIEGLDLKRIAEESLMKELQASSKKFLDSGLMVEDQGHLRLTPKGRLLADGIAAELFFDGQGIEMTG
jgi:oxygen-independent coproporphyrinogen-3 oxidase